MSFAISIIGCIFGCRISNAPNYEYQTKHHFCIGKPEKERCANCGECPHPYARHIRKPAHWVYNGLPHRCSQMGFRQAASKERVYQQIKAKCIWNQCRSAEILCRNSKCVQGVWGTGNHANYPTTKGCIQPADEECQRRTAGRSTDKFLGGVRWICKRMRQSE